MPTYQYACTNAECGNEFELVQSFTDPAASECPVCSGRVRKVFSAVGVVFKGSGFYRTDSREGSKAGGSKGAAAKSGGSDSGGSASGGSEPSSSGSSGSPGSSSGSSSGSGSGSGAGSAAPSSPSTPAAASA